MIRTLKCATNLPELLFVCQQYNILPILTESMFLGLALARALYEEHSDKKLAFLDSDTLLEVISYDDEAELLPYMKQRQFNCGYKVEKDGEAIKITGEGDKCQQDTPIK